MVKQFFLFLFFGFWLSLAGCSAFEEATKKGPPTPPPPPIMAHPFTDIPVPNGFKRDHSKSFIYESGSSTIKVGQLFFYGWSDLSAVISFYKNEMINKGWTLINTMGHSPTVMHYEKEGWVCNLLIKSVLGQVYIEIQAGPK